MKLIERNGDTEIWVSQESYGLEFWVYGCTESGDPFTAPNIDMARQIAAGYA